MGDRVNSFLAYKISDPEPALLFSLLRKAGLEMTLQIVHFTPARRHTEHNTCKCRHKLWI